MYFLSYDEQLRAPGSGFNYMAIYCLPVSENYITMPPKKGSREEEMRALAKAEEDLMRLTASRERMRGLERYREQERAKKGQDVVRTRECLARQERLVGQHQEVVDRAKRVFKASRAEGQRVRRQLAEEEREVKECEKALELARADTKVKD